MTERFFFAKKWCIHVLFVFSHTSREVIKLKHVAVLFLLFLFIPVSFVSAMPEEEEIRLDQAVIDQYGLPHLDKGFIDQHKLEGLMEGLASKLYIPPVDAMMEQNGKIHSEKNGRALDREKFDMEFRNTFYGNARTKLLVPVRTIYPKVNKELLKEISNKRLGTYTTFYKTSNKERSTNIELATEAVNSTVIFPGKTFSFNQVVGERTAEKGYKRAPVIVKGEFSEDIGGGICQVSSTLFNAVDLKGIQIEERYAHSREVPYVPPGRDATVSWWGPDFTFKNMYNEPILILANAKNGRLTVSVYTAESAEHFTGRNRE